ncbi:MAG: helix-turn-helix transcriptional regulator [Clostridia bacterium]|nr:helix-turn-helix transcriptional regulator [Clostridia bacterium]
MKSMNLYENFALSKGPLRIREFENDTHIKFYLHWHEHTELLYVMDGEMTVRCGDEMFELKKNDCIIINSNELHQGFGGHCRYGCIILSPEFFDHQYYVFENKINDPVITDYMYKIFSNFNQLEITLENKGYAHLAMFYLINNYCIKKLDDLSYIRHFEKLDKINSTMKYIDDNYAGDITTEMLAGRLHISEGHFCHIFKEIVGKSAKEYLIEIRLQKATDLIRTTDLTITEIALSCGFSDSNYFSRLFKKYIGHTPSTYRA